MGNLRESNEGLHGSGIYVGPPSMVLKFAQEFVRRPIFLRVRFPKSKLLPKKRGNTYEVVLTETDEREITAIEQIVSFCNFKNYIHETQM